MLDPHHEVPLRHLEPPPVSTAVFSAPSSNPGQPKMKLLLDQRSTEVRHEERANLGHKSEQAEGIAARRHTAKGQSLEAEPHI